jgi:hypothetical protein
MDFHEIAGTRAAIDARNPLLVDQRVEAEGFELDGRQAT